MSEHHIELAGSGYMLQEPNAQAELSNLGLSDFEIVWNAAICALYESKSFFIRLGDENYGAYTEPPHSPDPDVIKLEQSFSNRNGHRLDLLTLRKAGQATLYISRSSVESTIMDPSSYSGFADFYGSPKETTWPDGHPETVNYLRNLADSIDNRVRQRSNTNHSIEDDETLTYEQSTPQPEPIEVNELVLMLNSLKYAAHKDTSMIVTILNAEYEKLDSKYTGEEDKAVLKRNMMKLLKRTMARLHPDTGLGDAEMFKVVSNMRDKLKRDIVNEDKTK